MKKLPLFAGAMLVTLLAAVLAVPYWMGGKIEEAFRDAMHQASAKALKDVRLRLWTPQGATIAFVKQVNPTIEDMTANVRVYPKIGDPSAWAHQGRLDYRPEEQTAPS